MWRLELLSAILPIAAACAGFGGVAWLTGRVLLARIAWPLRLRLGDRGTSELEFALALPFFLISVLTTVQMALMVNAALVVDYAAFCAARSAAVWVPQTLPDEPANTMADPEQNDSEKWRRIRGAATIACTPIAPRLSQFAFGFLPRPPVAIGAAFRELSTINGTNVGGLSLPLGVDALDKWLYADLYTDVALLDGGGEASLQFPADAPITARVTHRFYMNVPFAGQAIGAVVGDRFLWFLGPYYVPVSASYTLMAAHG
jgi:hypothetical protein